MMETANTFDVIVIGAGAGGICGALAAARSGARTLLLEKGSSIGGTGVHSPVSLICKFHGTDHRPVNLGIHRELFPHAYLHSTRDRRTTAPRLTYDDKELARRYVDLLDREKGVEVRTGDGVSTVKASHRRIQSVRTDSGVRLSAPVLVDATADGNLAELAGASCMKGRESDGALQSATLVFGLSGVRKSSLRQPEYATRGGLQSLWNDLNKIYHKAKATGAITNPKGNVVCFPYPDGERLLFNSNEILGVDPTVPGSVEKALEKGQGYIDELVAVLRHHPAFREAKIEFVAPKLGVREGRRIAGDYCLTEDDCLGEARFDDMVAACAYEIDIHDPRGEKTRMVDIPGSGYYHIPYRSLIARDLDNLLLGSRCISGTHEAHSSYRVISGVTAIGQAAGTAAALASRYTGGLVREIPSAWVRHVLREQVQFVEGETAIPPDWETELV